MRSSFLWILLMGSPLSLFAQSNDFLQSRERGALLYQDYCQHCHLPNGQGSAVVPPLAQSDWMQKNRTGTLHALKYGQKGPIVVNGKKYNSYMPPMGLEEEEIADICNFIFTNWGNHLDKPFTPEEVKKVSLNPK